MILLILYEYIATTFKLDFGKLSYILYHAYMCAFTTNTFNEIYILSKVVEDDGNEH